VAVLFATKSEWSSREREALDQPTKGRANKPTRQTIIEANSRVAHVEDPDFESERQSMEKNPLTIVRRVVVSSFLLDPRQRLKECHVVLAQQPLLSARCAGSTWIRQ
jgi:hypothetical protein